MITFAVVSFLMFITPGPGVLSLAGVGAAYGWQRGLQYMAGLFAGHFIVSIAVITGLAAIILSEPIIRTLLLFSSAGYLGYLALKISLAGSRVSFINLHAPSFVTGMTLQFINPKAYAVHTTFFTGFAFYPSNFIIETTLKLFIMNVIWLTLHLIWLGAGCKLNELNLSANKQKSVNLFMAVCLVGVAGLSIWSIR
ncbi:LysE family translocator [Pseudopelagicola sp. nBUS_19]|uniref:LysE family translocator n=1 Tax=unclassified Pseudopelagicola TaxID=2649563 RepID=UPI003EBABED3